METRKMKSCLKHSLFDYYVRFVYKFKYTILFFWLLCLIFGVVFGFRLFKETVNDLQPPEGTQTRAMSGITQTYFPRLGGAFSSFAYFHSYGDKNITEHTCLKDVSTGIMKDIDKYEDDTNRTILHSKMLGAFLTENENITKQFISENGKGTVLVFEIEHAKKGLYEDYAVLTNIVKEDVEKHCTPEERKGFMFGMIGMAQFLVDVRENIVDDLMVMDTLCIPIAFVILVMMLRSIRLILITLFCTGTAVTTSFLIMYPIAAFAMDTVTFAPSVMMSICLALSIDYSLFLLSRFREELQKGNTISRAIHMMVKYAGRIILLSGSILTVAFLSNLFLNNNLLLSLGTASAIATMINLIVNITAIPSFIFAFPSFFSDFGWLGFGSCFQYVPCCSYKLWKVIGFHSFKTKREIILESSFYTKAIDDMKAEKMEAAHTAAPAKDGTETEGAQAGKEEMGASGSPSYDDEETQIFVRALQHEQATSKWFRLASCTTKTPMAILVSAIIILCAVPFAVFYLGYMNESLDNTEILAQGSFSLQLYRVLGQDFPPGTIQPMNLIIDAQNCGGTWNNNFFFWAWHLADDIITAFPQMLNNHSVLSAVYHDGEMIPFYFADRAMNNDCEDIEEICEAYLVAHHRYVSEVDKNVSFILALNSLIDPMSEASFNILPSLYDFAENYLKEHPHPVDPEDWPSSSHSSSLSSSRSSSHSSFQAPHNTTRALERERSEKRLFEKMRRVYHRCPTYEDFQAMMLDPTLDTNDDDENGRDDGNSTSGRHHTTIDPVQALKFARAMKDFAYPPATPSTAESLRPTLASLSSLSSSSPSSSSLSSKPSRSRPPQTPRFSTAAASAVSLSNGVSIPTPLSLPSPSLSLSSSSPLSAPSRGVRERTVLSAAKAKKPSRFPFTSPDGMILGYNGMTITQADSVRAIYAVLPYAILISLSIVFVAVGLIFRSVVVPFRTVFSLGVTMLTVFGMLVILFQYSLLRWTIPFLGSISSLYYFVPVFGYSLIIGLALDYDIFLFYRIAEYRDLGYTDRASIVKATSRSGSIITAAGIVMAVAFFGLTVSKMVVLVEFGVMLVITVLLDTFVVRVFLVPALCSLLGRLNWFPGKRCPATRDVNDMSDQMEEELNIPSAPAKAEGEGEGEGEGESVGAVEQKWEDWMGIPPTSVLMMPAQTLLTRMFPTRKGISLLSSPLTSSSSPSSASASASSCVSSQGEGAGSSLPYQQQMYGTAASSSLNSDVPPAHATEATPLIH